MESSAADTITARRRKWVWHSTPDSIEAGQISLFALAEIPVATVVFGWLLLNNPWPWTSVIGLMAAPILLLRSDASVEMGLAMLRRYKAGLDSDKRSVGAMAVALILGIATGAGIAFAFDALVAYPAEWTLRLAWMAVFCGGSVTIGVALGVSYGSWKATIAGTLAAVLSGIAIVDWPNGAVAAATSIVVIALYLIIKRAFNIRSISSIGRIVESLFPLVAAAPIAAIGIGLGLLGRVITIRLWASLSHIRAGLAALPVNWLNTIAKIDTAHLPELAPRAGEISNLFALDTLLRIKGTDVWVVKALLAPVIYLPALAYRWNIKASWWLWGPVALLLRPASWRRDEDMRCATAFWSTWAMQTVLAGALITLAGWLAWPVLPREFQALLPNAKLVQAFIASPHFSLRLGLAALAIFCLGMMLLNAYRVRSAHAKALEGAADFHKSYDESLRADLRAMARPLRRWQQATAALMIFTIWSFALKFALDYWPEQTGHAVWQWLLPWL